MSEGKLAVSSIHRAGAFGIALTRLHAVAFLAIASVCLIAPEVTFGDAGWLQLPRLAIQSFAAALLSLSLVMIGAAHSGNAREISRALLAALLFDAQAPLLLMSQPGALEYMDRELGVFWGTLPLSFAIAVGVTLYTLLRLRSQRIAAGDAQR
jgi:hypothetical protein